MLYRSVGKPSAGPGHGAQPTRVRASHGGSAAPALLGSGDVPPGIWTHPLGALNPSHVGEEEGCVGL